MIVFIVALCSSLNTVSIVFIVVCSENFEGFFFHLIPRLFELKWCCLVFTYQLVSFNDFFFIIVWENSKLDDVSTLTEWFILACRRRNIINLRLYFVGGASFYPMATWLLQLVVMEDILVGSSLFRPMSLGRSYLTCVMRKL